MIEKEMTCPICEEVFDVQLEDGSIDRMEIDPMETDCPECGETIVFTYAWVTEKFEIENAVDEIEIDEDEDDE